MRSKLKIEILKLLLRGPVTAMEIFSIILDPYQNQLRLAEESEAFFQSIEEWQKTRDQKKKFNRLIYLLKKEGFIESTRRKGEVNGVINITNKGKNKIEVINHRQYAKEEPDADNCFKIIAFDIPESDRKKRHWLRSMLADMKFSMVQKSVWFGKSKIPKEFLNDLIEKNIFDKVEILMIDKLGSLNKMNVK